MAELEPIIMRSKLTVRARLPKDLPADHERPAEGEADHAQSAEQRAEVHARRASITISARRTMRANGRRALSVADTGIGIAPRGSGRRSSRTSGSSTTRRRAPTAARVSACRFAGGWRRCSAARIDAGERGRQRVDVHADPADSRDAMSTHKPSRPRVLVVDDYRMHARCKRVPAVLRVRVVEAGNGMEALQTGARTDARTSS